MTKWFATDKKIFSHAMFEGDVFSRRDAWLWMIANAAYCDHETKTKGKVIKLKRGQLLAARSHLAEIWGWGEQSVRTFLRQLEKNGMIEFSNQSDGHLPNVVTVCNYIKYQSKQAEHKPVKQPEPNQSLTRAQPEPNHTVQDIQKKQEVTTDASAKEVVVASAIDLDERAKVGSVCTRAAGQAMKFNSANIHDMSPVMGCIERGADLEKDVVPTIQRMVVALPAGKISSWNYFKDAIDKAAHDRKTAAPVKQKPLSFVESTKQLAAAYKDPDFFKVAIDYPYMLEIPPGDRPQGWEEYQRKNGVAHAH
jgi:hypothetical protein